MSQSSPRRTLVFVGTYTRPEPHVKAASGKGIYTFELDRATGALSFLSLTENIASPSFLAVDRAGRYLYAISEVSQEPEGWLSAYAIDRETGGLRFINRQPTHGSGPAYVSVDATGRYAFVANYGGGEAVAMFPIRPDGGLEPESHTVRHQGSSVNPDRQTSPHPHCTVVDPSNRFLLVADLGIDRIVCYRIDHDAGKLAPCDPPGVSADPGAGPRHIAFHPNGRFVYNIQELDSRITAYAFDNGRMEALQTVPALPDDFSGQSTAADIRVHPNGRFVYASNRGHDSIVAYAIDESGRLSYIAHQSTRGETPRNFNLDPGGGFLLAANQDSDTIVTFRVDGTTGVLEDTGVVTNTPTPVCIEMIEV